MTAKDLVPAFLIPVLLPALSPTVGALPALAGGEIHGTVATRHGDTWTGTIRWDKNENFWDDVVDATKVEKIQPAGRENVDIKIFGFRISHSGARESRYARFSIPFGHLSWIEPDGRTRVRIGLKNGDVLEVRQGADLGRSVRGIAVNTKEGNQVELDWEDLDRVDFSEGSDSGPDRERLYGTVETEVGDFTGYVVWDRDESLAEDILDGEEGGHSHKIAFGDIRSIERLNSRTSRVNLRSGDTLELRGTNDVNRDNRGIDVTVPGVGLVRVQWDEFRKVTFQSPPSSEGYADYDGGRRLSGTVTTAEGDSFSGQIVWDHDEIYSWESLDGEIRHVEFGVLFQNIARIEPESRDAAKVVLRDGLELTLEGSNDVDVDNKGILVHTEDGKDVDVAWGALRKVVFD